MILIVLTIAFSWCNIRREKYCVALQFGECILESPLKGNCNKCLINKDICPENGTRADRLARKQLITKGSSSMFAENLKRYSYSFVIDPWLTRRIEDIWHS